MHEEEFLISWLEAQIEVDKIIEEVVNADTPRSTESGTEAAVGSAETPSDTGDIPAPIT